MEPQEGGFLLKAWGGNVSRSGATIVERKNGWKMVGSLLKQGNLMHLCVGFFMLIKIVNQQSSYTLNL